jgi:hypothetical protein
MFVRIIKPAPAGTYVAPDGCVIVNDDDGLTIDYLAPAALVEDGTVEIIVNGAKVREEPNYREPTDAELIARHPDALYISKEMAPGDVVEVKVADGFEPKQAFDGWQNARKA